MNITQTTTITGIPGFKQIVIEPSEHSAHGAHIVLDDGTQPDDFGGSGRRPFSISEAIQVRDALSESIKHAEALTAALAPQPVPLFTLGQELSGDEDLPRGTVIVDGEGDRWGLGLNGWGTDANGDITFNGRESLSTAVRGFGPVRIAILP